MKPEERSCEVANQAAAIVSLEDCDPSRPVPAMTFHGTDDPVVNSEGREMHGWLLRSAAGITDAPTGFVSADELPD